MPPYRGHYAIVGIQEPPLLTAVFCQPIAIGGPGAAQLDFPAWPILVPTSDGIQVCFTPDEEFRNTYLQRGFCGLDASFRDQFDHDYDCSVPIIHVAPTVDEEKQDGAVEGDAPSGADLEQQDVKQDGDKKVTVWSVLGHELSRRFKFFWWVLVETCKLLSTAVLYLLSFVLLFFLTTSGLAVAIFCFRFGFYLVGLGSDPRHWDDKENKADNGPIVTVASRAEDGPRADEESKADAEPTADDERKSDEQQTTVNPLTTNNLLSVDSDPKLGNHPKPDNRPKTDNQPNMSGSCLWEQAAPATRTHAAMQDSSPPHVYPSQPYHSSLYPSGEYHPSFVYPHSSQRSRGYRPGSSGYVPPFRLAQQRQQQQHRGSEYDTDDVGGLATPSSGSSLFSKYSG